MKLLKRGHMTFIAAVLISLMVHFAALAGLPGFTLEGLLSPRVFVATLEEGPPQKKSVSIPAGKLMQGAHEGADSAESEQTPPSYDTGGRAADIFTETAAESAPVDGPYRTTGQHEDITHI